ncbi:hypothetical protein DFP72DRAFT_35787 [Ephemerocybe angulata]|uniref:C2H2-type domain-containing protein n=1 Tax=Ephemerocybe angulata TaxID=980116 RepID=A0A8H6I9Y4_9AGAR|nr:hypothetical protein DFP72DRAFT_35787 [Tulosesus angulatus]
MTVDEKPKASSPPAMNSLTPPQSNLPQLQPPPPSDSQHLPQDALSRSPYVPTPEQLELAFPAVGGPIPQGHGIPTEGPATHPDGPPPVGDYIRYTPPIPLQGQQIYFAPHPLPQPPQLQASTSTPPPQNMSNVPQNDKRSPKSSSDLLAPNASELYNRAQQLIAAAAAVQAAENGMAPPANHYPSSSGVRLPPILQVEKQQVTTSATQLASASRRRNEAHFVCPVPGCGSTFTRRFNLRGHLRSHTEERPYVCEWPGCKKGFARQHDCKRHQALHTAKSQSNVCLGCKKTFSRLDALNRHCEFSSLPSSLTIEY